MSNGSSSLSRTAPQLIFDDGSRAMAEKNPSSVAANLVMNPRGNTPIREYYEIDRLSKEIAALNILHNKRVALQFPDEMLADAPEVCWEFERTLGDDNVLVFCLGDTTYAPCCPDQVAAAHLQADCLVHYGHACLSACRQIPVFYSFGKTAMDVNSCADAVLKQTAENKVERLLLLYQVQYKHAMEDLRVRLVEQGNFLHVLVGEIPLPELNAKAAVCPRSDCCSRPSTENVETETPPISVPAVADKGLENSEGTLIAGGLQIPKNVDLTEYAMLFVGSDSSRQYMNIILRFLSGSGPKHTWTWHDGQLVTELSSTFQRKLNRRFYLIQRAKQCRVFGILVANLSDTNMRQVVASLRQLLESEGKSSYTFVVGKINPAKLANFADVDCFVLVACPEHSLLEDEKEFPVPVITPLELGMALGLAEWGSVQYSLDTNDYLALSIATNTNSDDKADGEDADAPYFSLVTGRYELSTSKRDEVDLLSLPGQGQLTAYNSAAADFLKQRDYQGLEVQAGATEVHTAVPGLQGIASGYDGR